MSKVVASINFAEKICGTWNFENEKEMKEYSIAPDFEAIKKLEAEAAEKKEDAVDIKYVPFIVYGADNKPVINVEVNRGLRIHDHHKTMVAVRKVVEKEQPIEVVNKDNTEVQAEPKEVVYYALDFLKHEHHR